MRIAGAFMGAILGWVTGFWRTTAYAKFDAWIGRKSWRVIPVYLGLFGSVAIVYSVIGRT